MQWRLRLLAPDPVITPAAGLCQMTEIRVSIQIVILQLKLVCRCLLPTPGHLFADPGSLVSMSFGVARLPFVGVWAAFRRSDILRLSIPCAPFLAQKHFYRCVYNRFL